MVPSQALPLPQRWFPSQAAPPAASGDVYLEADRADPIRALAFRFALLLLFIRVSMIHQISTVALGVNLHMLMIATLPAILGLVIAGGIRRALRTRAASWWMAFAVWMVMAIPFSTWISGSFTRVQQYFTYELLLFLVVGGMAVNWKECRALMMAFAAGSVLTMLNARMFNDEENARSGMQFGTVANANDLAAHLLAVLPFLLWLSFISKNRLVRVLSVMGCFYGMYVIVSTASRGAAVALAVCFVFFLVRANPTQRMMAMITVPLALMVIVAAVPQRALHRIRSFGTDADADEEAVQSRSAREYLLRRSIAYTFKRPIFGVGPGQFSSYEGQNNQVIGDHGRWQETHNAYTQVSSECGIPALIFYLGAIFCSLGAMRRTFREASERPECRDIKVSAFCVSLAIIGYSVATIFLSMAYYFYLPALTGLAMALANAARQEFATRTRVEQVAMFPASRWSAPAAVR